MSDDKSILLRLEEHGHPVPRVALEGTVRSEKATERYETVGELARGGVGIVHRGRDNDVGRDVALKVLRDEHLGDREMIQRFVEEAQIGGQLQHPGIVPVYELGLQSDKRPYFAMKLVKGETLAVRLAERRDPSDGRRGLLAVFREVCRTVAYAHSRGVIHRALKPSNVMIGNFGEVQVVDWGFAKVIRRGGVADERLARKAERDATMISTVRTGEGTAASIAGSVMGTPAYMPPEQAMGRVDDLDARSDIFSLGGILCEILTGQPPYSGNTQQRMTAAAQADLYDALDRLDRCGASPKLIDLCRRCLEPLPKDRPATAQLLAAEAASYLKSAEGRAHQARLRAAKAEARAEEQRRSRRQTRIVGSAVVLVLALAVGAYLAYDSARSNRAMERRSAIEAALQDAERLRNANGWEAALAAARRAIELGDDGSLARTIESESAAATARIQREAEDDALLAHLESLLDRALNRTVDARATDAAFEAAFSRPEATESRLRASRHAPQLAAYLSIWGWIRNVKLREEDSEWIAQLAQRIAPGDAELQAALIADDTDRLTRLAHEQRDDLPVAMVVRVGAVLMHRHPAAAVEFLTRQLERCADEFWVHVTLCHAAHRCGEHERASRHATAAVAIRPRDAIAWNGLGIARHGNGDWEGAARAHQRAIELSPRNGAAYNNLGNVLHKLGRLDEAIARFRHALELTPDGSHVHSNLAGALQATGDSQGAVEHAREALRLDPSLVRARVNLASALNGLGQVEEAIATLQRALEVDPDMTECYVNLANFHIVKRDYAKAAELARKAVALSPQTSQAHYNLGIAQAQLGQVDEGIVALRRAIELGTPTAAYRAMLGWAYFKSGKFEHAVEECERALELDPDSYLSHTTMGDVARLRGSYDNAIAAYTKALRIQPESHHVLSCCSEAYFHKGAFAEAEELLRRLLALDPDHVKGNGHLAVTLRSKGDTKEAVAVARRTVALASQNAWAHAILGTTLLSDGDPEAAIASCRTAIRIDPELALAHGTLGNALARKDEMAAAVSSMRRAVELSPHDAGWRRGLYQLLARQHGPTLQRILDGSAEPPADAATRLLFAELFVGARRPDAAARMYRLAFDADPRFLTANAYAAACAAAQAGAAHHDQAYRWLRAHLATIRKMDAKQTAAALNRWRHDDALNDVDPEMTDGLDQKWKVLWAEVAELAKK